MLARGRRLARRLGTAAEGSLVKTCGTRSRPMRACPRSSSAQHARPCSSGTTCTTSARAGATARPRLVTSTTAMGRRNRRGSSNRLPTLPRRPAWTAGPQQTPATTMRQQRRPPPDGALASVARRSPRPGRAPGTTAKTVPAAAASPGMTGSKRARPRGLTRAWPCLSRP